jgi:putative tricarboxylic transport membrane protein
LFFFGVLGFVMRQFGFPLAPMILGVVLGNIAELNLARALAIDADPILFFVRPWSLFFAIVAVFSMIFPIYQKHRDTGSLLERTFSPLVLLSLSLPLFMMGGLLRTTLAVAAIAISSSILWRRFGSQSKA